MKLERLNRTHAGCTRTLAMLLVSCAATYGAGCAVELQDPIDDELVNEQGVLTLTDYKYDIHNQREFKVTIRYGLGMQDEEIEAMFEDMEILPVEEAFPIDDHIAVQALDGNEEAPGLDSAADALEPDINDGGDGRFLEVTLDQVVADEQDQDYAWRLTRRLTEATEQHTVDSTDEGQVPYFLQGWAVPPYGTRTGMRVKCWTYATSLNVLSGVGGTHSIYAGDLGKIFISSEWAFPGIPSSLLTHSWKRRYYRTKFTNGPISGVVQDTFVCF